ncbi:MAG: fibrinogen-like YCDxxxxGGGW domain-containing protein, partial [Candidatus Gracilibacteria bacterium]|nr:fibrinogen-like YCDxxxxGGGW domain-containing protein [Candidatus Gracilibacteria bacterium]
TGVTFTVGTCDGLKQDFICKDGVWKNGETILDTNTYAYETCTVEGAQNCTHLDTNFNHADNFPVYSVNNIAWNATENCSDSGIQGSVTCNDGTVTGDTGYAYKVCVKGTPSNCSADASYDDGGVLLQTYDVPQLNHGLSYTGNLDIPENNGTFRYSLDVICDNGTLSPTETGPEYQSCNAGYFWNSSSCELQWTGNATTGYLYKNTIGVEQYPLNCNDLLDQTTWKNTLTGSPWNGSVFTSGVYWIKPNSNSAFKVYCDMTNSSGGWTLLSNVVSYDGTNVYSSGTACTSTSTNCGGDLAKLGNSTLDYTKVKIVHQNGKYVIFNLKNGGHFENMFTGLATYAGTLDGAYIYEDNMFSRAGYSDMLQYWGANSGANSMWLANNSSSNTGWHTYGYKWSGNCASIGYSNGVSSCIATGGYSIFVKKETETSLGSISTFPAKSCKAIKDAGYSTGNGVYWIKPDTNAAFQVYCDMTTDGGGWTLVRKMKSDTAVSSSTTANNASSLTTLTTASANLADTTWNALNPTQVWNICNGYQTIYNRNTAVAWYSNHGVTDICSYNRNFWTSMQKNFGTAAITTFTYQACGGGYSTTYTAWGIISGIYLGNTYKGCYDAQYGVNTTSAAPAIYDNRSGSAIGWSGNGYVLVR